ncbi:MAG: hypothetical protein M3536_00360 [Actinomycetota bacterium]|nr:hypothetical protein [Actinomycetota bacterium]
MNKKTIHGIDLTAPGGLEALFAFRRAQFGDATMSVAPGEPAPAAPAAPVPAPPVAPPAAPAVAKPWGDDSQFDPDKAWTLIENLRAELKAKATPAAPAPAHPAVPAPAAPATPATPAVEPVPADDGKDAKIRDLTIRVSLTDSLTKHGAGPLTAAVLRGEDAFKDLDPTAPDFQEKLDAVVKDAVTKHPELKAVQAAGASGANFSGGSGESAKKQTTLAGAVANHYRT